MSAPIAPGDEGNTGMSRRALLATALAVGGAVPLRSSLDRTGIAVPEAQAQHLQVLRPYAVAEHHGFMHGVASGDPLPTSVVLWTRVTPAPQAVPGSGAGAPVTVGWELARDAAFHDILATGQQVATPEHDHTVHVDATGLEPHTTYYYRFTALDSPVAGETSVVGRTWITPEPDAHPDALCLAVCSCANLEAGYFNAYRDIARRARAGEFDAVIHLGDYIYEYAHAAKPGKHGVARPFVPEWELSTRADYSARYGCYRRDPDLQDAHAALPWIVTWDDHEVANNWNSEGAPDHSATRGPWELRRDGAMEAYFDWMPVRGPSPAEGGRLYRTLRFGSLVEINMLDLRTYRRGPGQLIPGRPGSTVVGSEQFEWLAGRLATSDTRWTLVGNSVMICPVSILGLGAAIKPIVQSMLGTDRSGEVSPVMNLDQWDGYVADRYRLLRTVSRVRPDGSTIFLTGDIHSEWAGCLEFEGSVIGAELVTSSISATNLDDRLHLPKNSEVSRAARAHLLNANPHFSHLNLDEHGYMIVDADDEEVRGQWMRVGDVSDPDSPVAPGPRCRYDGATLVAYDTHSGSPERT